MRFENSENPNIVAVLDTLPECKIILDALEDPSFQKPILNNEGANSFADTMGVRFRLQARRTEYHNTNTAEPPGFSYNDSWQTEPQFRVRRDDVVFVIAAAERTLNESKITERAFNYFTKRTKAAKIIVAMLAEV